MMMNCEEEAILVVRPRLRRMILSSKPNQPSPVREEQGQGLEIEDRKEKQLNGVQSTDKEVETGISG